MHPPATEGHGQAHQTSRKGGATTAKLKLAGYDKPLALMMTFSSCHNGDRHCRAGYAASPPGWTHHFAWMSPLS